MANIVSASNIITDAAVDEAFMTEIRRGFQLEKATEEARHRSAAQEAAEFRKHNRTVKGLGKIVACIPDREFFRMVEKYGHDEVHSKEFMKGLRKHEPDLMVNRV